jgi:hypothetical protein
MPPLSADHDQDCPSNTGIYPVQIEDVTCKCPCGEVSHEGGLRCGECSVELKVGDFYSHLRIREHEGWIGLIVCLFCAATKKKASDDDTSTSAQEDE